MDTPSRQRILSVDQFRGYTIFGMILVNFLGQFPHMPETLKHHGVGMSYADTIAPIFLFVAGMGFRLSFLRNSERSGEWRAVLTGARRYAILTLIGIVYYNPVDWREWWDALVDIGISGILALPFMGRSGLVRALAACGYLALYQALFTWTAYGPWLMEHSFDGGPLGPLSWAFCLLLGTIAYDLIATKDARRIVLGCLAWGIGLSMAGWLLRAEWHGVKTFWPFSQQGMTVPYPLYATGISFLIYLGFYILSDVWGKELPTLTIVGTNPLVLYILHTAYCDIKGTIVPAESSALVALAAFGGLYAMCYVVARYLYRNGVIVKI